MKPAFCLLASIVALGSCQKGPKVELKNATGNEVASAVKQSGVMNSSAMIEPGLWKSTVTVFEMNMPGLPAQYADKMKEEMAKSRNQSSSHCITAADVRKPKEDFFGADKSCKYQHFTMGGGKIDISMVCGEERMTQTTSMAGSYTPTTYSMDMSTRGSGGEGSGMSMKMHVDAQRVGECTGQEG